MEEFVLKKNATGDELECSNCGSDIESDEEYAEINDGSVLCMGCFDNAYPKCEFCGKRVNEDDMEYWGDCLCCPECYEGFNPSFNQAQNEEETTEAYKAMQKRYIGRKSQSYQDETVELEAEYDDCGVVTYRMDVTVDEEGIITDISRLMAEILLSESEKSSSWDSYIIRNEDYEDKVDEMMQELDLE